jgi:hypothetical protein
MGIILLEGPLHICWASGYIGFLRQRSAQVDDGLDDRALSLRVHC